MAQAELAAVPKSEWTAVDVLAGHDLTGRNAIVTGATSGIGVEIARGLANVGAGVTLAVRDVARGREVAREIAEDTGVSVAVEMLDLLSLGSVREFARRWASKPLGLLVNNAGLMAPPFARTEDGFESQMAVNYVAPFLLSELLLANLREGAPARVIIVSSGSHHLAELRLDDLHYEQRDYDKFEAYGHAKLCANLLAVEYSRRHARDGVTMNAVTPGGVQTNLGRHTTFDDAVRLGWVNADGSLPQGKMKTVEQGAASPLWAALAPELEGRGGLYVEDCAVAPLWAPPMPSCWGVTAQSLDINDSRKLWDLTEEMIAEKLP